MAKVPKIKNVRWCLKFIFNFYYEKNQKNDIYKKCTTGNIFIEDFLSFEYLSQNCIGFTNQFVIIFQTDIYKFKL